MGTRTRYNADLSFYTRKSGFPTTLFLSLSLPALRESHACGGPTLSGPMAWEKAPLTQKNSDGIAMFVCLLRLTSDEDSMAL